MAVRKCVDCGGKVSDSAKGCPHCGSTRSPKKNNSGWWGLLILLFIAFLIASTSSDEPSGSSGAGAATLNEAASKAAAATPPAPPASPKPKTKEELEQERRIARFGAQPVPSAWDGSYREVEKYLDVVARDPESVKVEGCTDVKVSPDGWLVGCNWRGRNGFGGMDRQANWFTIKGGRVVQMHDSSAFRE
jgi:hypothetical protein